MCTTCFANVTRNFAICSVCLAHVNHNFAQRSHRSSTLLAPENSVPQSWELQNRLGCHYRGRGATARQTTEVARHSSMWHTELAHEVTLQGGWVGNRLPRLLGSPGNPLLRSTTDTKDAPTLPLAYVHTLTAHRMQGVWLRILVSQLKAPTLTVKNPRNSWQGTIP